MSLNYVTWHSYWTSFLSGPKICNFDFLYLKWYICRILPVHSGRWVGTGYQCVGHLGKAQHMENEEIFFKKNLKPEHHKVAFVSSHVSLTSASHPPAVNLRINCFQRSLHFCIPTSFSLSSIYIFALFDRFQTPLQLYIHATHSLPTELPFHIDIFLTNVRRFGRFHVHFSLFLAHHILQHFSPKTLLHWQCHTF